MTACQSTSPSEQSLLPLEQPAPTKQVLMEPLSATRLPLSSPTVTGNEGAQETDGIGTNTISTTIETDLHEPLQVTIPTTTSLGFTAASIFDIQSEGTEARFFINEILLGSANTVEGVTSAVSGTIMINLENLHETEIGLVRIDARTLTTDSETRNRSIQRRILLSALDQNRFIDFTPTTLIGLPDQVTIGEPFTFAVVGMLKIREFSRSETFEMEVTAISESEIQGFGTTTIRYADYDIIIPNVEPVAGVEDEVRLEIEFKARPVET